MVKKTKCIIPSLDEEIEKKRKVTKNFAKDWNAKDTLLRKKLGISRIKGSELSEFVGTDYAEEDDNFKPNERKYCREAMKLWESLTKKHKIDETDESGMTFYVKIGWQEWVMRFGWKGDLYDIDCLKH
jgi:hypothetical protein